MSVVKMRRWVCPNCGGWVLAPSRPRKDDVRRFCLKCSAMSGRLVQRHCPAVDKQRVDKVEKRRAAAARRRERERAALVERHTVDGLDVRSELARLCRLPFVRSHLSAPRHPPTLTVAWSKDKGYTTGHAKVGEWAIHLGLYEGCPRHEAQALLAHELAHAILPAVRHGERWRRAYARIVAEAYGLEQIPARAMEGTRFTLDALVEQALREHNEDDRKTMREREEEKRRMT
jgi:hypothetical protein